MTFAFITTYWALFCAFAQSPSGSNILFAGIILAALCGLGGKAVLLLTLGLHLILIAG